MNCQEFENRFHDLLDDRKPPGNDPALRSHAQACSECRELLTAEGQMWSGLQASRAAPPGRDFADRVVAELSRPSPRTSSFRLDGRWLAVALTAVAAMTLLMYSPAWYRRPNNGSKPIVVVDRNHVRPSTTPDAADGWDDYKLVWDQLSVALPQWEYEEMTPSGTWALVTYAIDFFRRTFPEEHSRPTNPADNQPRGAAIHQRDFAVWS